MKKILLFFTVLMSAISAFADDEAINGVYWNKEIDGIYYNLNTETKYATVTHDGKRDPNEEAYVPAGNSYSGDVVIPSSVTYNGETYSVIEISTYAFCNCADLNSVEIPNSVTEIGHGAFKNCTGLSYVKLPTSLNAIYSNLFEGCTSLTSFDIPESVKYISELAFMNCTSLSSITIPNSVKYIEDAVFYACTGLKSAIISNSVIRIGEQTFKNCSELTNVTIGEGLSTIADQSFWGCDKLESVTILATTPPEFEWGDEAFSYYGTLHVKKDCKEAYSNALYWKNFNIVEDADATGINDMKLENSETPVPLNSAIYNLQGVEVNDSYRGIIIKNGKKVMK